MVLYFKITKLHCNGCVTKAKNILSAVSGITDIQIDLSSELMTISSSIALDPVDIITAIESNSSWKVTEVSQQPRNLLPLPIKKFLPLLALFTCAIILSLVFDFVRNQWAAHEVMAHFMASFFFIFGGLKVINIKKFAKSFSEYDLITRIDPDYGYTYAVLEVLLGTLYLFVPNSVVLNSFVVVLFTEQTIGISQKLKAGLQPQCACLGGFFNIPISVVTIVENAIMIIMALIMIFVG